MSKILLILLFDLLINAVDHSSIIRKTKIKGGFEALVDSLLNRKYGTVINLEVKINVRDGKYPVYRRKRFLDNHEILEEERREKEEREERQRREINRKTAAGVVITMVIFGGVLCCLCLCRKTDDTSRTSRNTQVDDQLITRTTQLIHTTIQQTRITRIGSVDFLDFGTGQEERPSARTISSTTRQPPVINIPSRITRIGSVEFLDLGNGQEELSTACTISDPSLYDGSNNRNNVMLPTVILQDSNTPDLPPSYDEAVSYARSSAIRAENHRASASRLPRYKKRSL